MFKSRQRTITLTVVNLAYRIKDKTAIGRTYPYFMHYLISSLKNGGNKFCYINLWSHSNFTRRLTLKNLL